MSRNRGLLIVWSGPSGSGKGSILKRAMARDKNLCLSVSLTTRKKRPGEQDGIEYCFLSEENFLDKIKEGELLEYARYVDNYYGTQKAHVEELREQGRDVILEIEVVGAAQIKEKCPDCIMIFAKPPSKEDLRVRLKKRGTEDEEDIEKRMAQADRELSCAPEYDHIIINDDVSRAADELLDIIESYRKNREPA